MAAAGGSPGAGGRGGQGGLDLGLGGEDEQHGGHGDNWKLMMKLRDAKHCEADVGCVLVSRDDLVIYSGLRNTLSFTCDL